MSKTMTRLMMEYGAEKESKTTPTITQMPYQMRVEFFRRVMEGARCRWRNGRCDFLLRLVRRIDKKSARAREAKPVESY